MMFDFLKKFRSLAKNETAAEAVNVTPPQAAPSDGETSSEAVEEQIALNLEELRAAVEQGAAIAQYDLGLCYEEGWGVAKSEVEARRYYHLAAEQGHELAKKALNEMNA